MVWRGSELPHLLALFISENEAAGMKPVQIINYCLQATSIIRTKLKALVRQHLRACAS